MYVGMGHVKTRSEEVTAPDEGVLTLADLQGQAEDHPRRREPRAICLKRVAVLPYSAQGVWRFNEAWLADCSPSGVGLQTTCAMPVGEQFLLKLKAGGMLLLVIYTVRYCRPEPSTGVPGTPGRYRVGAEFTGFLRTGELNGTAALFQALLAMDDASAARPQP